MKLTYEGKYRSGNLTIAASTKEELDKSIDEFGLDNDTVPVIARSKLNNGNETTQYPTIAGALGPSAAIMAASTSTWGRLEPRTESEITEALRVNAIYFSQGSISGTLTYLTKAGKLRRIPKGDKFAYIPSAEALVTA